MTSRFLIAIAFAFLPAIVSAQEPAHAGHRVLTHGNGKLAIVQPDGKIEWEMKWNGIHDIHLMDNGNILTLDRQLAVVEIDPKTKKEVWRYDVTKANGNDGKKVEVHAVQPLENGNVMIAESGTARIIEVNKKGEIQKETKLKVNNPHPHMDTRLVRKTDDGHYLVCHEGDGVLREYDSETGKVVWEYEVPMFDKDPAGGHGPEAWGNKLFGAHRLENGNTLIATGNGHSLLEVNPKKEIVWKVAQKELPGITLAWVTTIDVRPNGNIVFGNCHAGPGQPLIIEIEPKTKNVVWQFDHFETFGNNVSNSLLMPIEAATTQDSATQEPATQKSASELPIGIVAEKPAEGIAIKVEQGYMVPYTTKIPGTDVEFTMIPIRPGKFKMGSPETEEDRNEDEGPQTEISIQPFWMGKFEVTWGEYGHYMDLVEHFKEFEDKGVRAVNDENKVDAITAPSALYDPSFTFEAGGLDDTEQAAGTMTQYAAKQYTKWLSKLTNDYYRLPFESEWEYACRAGTTTAFYFGDDPDELETHGWYASNSDETRHDCGEFPANPWGLHDMYGNVAEWVLDEYSEDGYTHLNDKKDITAESSYRQPKKVYPRVLRGGSWATEYEYECRSASRLASTRDWKDEDPNFPKSPWWYATMQEPLIGLSSGFRLVRPLNVPESAEAKNKYWEADVEKIVNDARNRIFENGRGAEGVVDQQLPQAIKDLNK